MFDQSVVFQRSDTGREEIHRKSHGLTQSERLVLIMVDGVSTYQEVRNKLPALTNERFDRAMQKLRTKELILEVLVPVEGQAPEELESTVVDRFLQQDPLDPVTIIMYDPEDELDCLQGMSSPPAVPQPVFKPESGLVSAAPNLSSQLESIPTLTAEPALDAFHSELADSLGEEVRARQPDRLVKLEDVMPLHFNTNAGIAAMAAAPAMAAMATMTATTAEDDSMFAPFKTVHWGYWLITLGVGFLAGYMLAKLGA